MTRPPIVESVLELIGETPMIHLNRVTPEGGAQLFAKLEFFNPGFSVKDRIGVGMISVAEQRGELKPGMTIVEPTAGNTGIGLALVGVQKGYRVIFVVPEGMAEEKVVLMKALGAEVVRTPMEVRMVGAIEKAKEIVATMPGAFCLQQFANESNPDTHFRTTGPEIWSALEGRVDSVVIGAGTGGTFTGVGRYMRAMNPAVRLILVEPQGSVFGGGQPGPKKVEGIGNSFVPEVLDLKLANEIITVHDPLAYEFVDRLAREEGLLVGGSSGAAAAAAFAEAKKLGVSKRVVTIFPDGAERYLSKYRFDGKL